MKPRAALLAVLGAVIFPPSAGAQEGLPPVGEEVEREDWSWTLVDARGLALGGGGLDANDVADLHARGFRAVLNYRGELPQEREPVEAAGMSYLFLDNTYAEEDTMPLSHMLAAVAFIESSLDAGEPVFVHCTGGWHRSAAGVVAYYMKTQHWRADEAWAHVASLRPGIEPRYMDALLGYEAYLFGEEKLTLDLWTERWDVAPNETVDLTASVTHHGTPVAGARVLLEAERTRARTEGVSDEQGLVHLSFTAVPGPLVQYVQARTTKEGYVDGYDRNVYWVKESKTRAPTTLALGELATVAPGGSVSLEARVAEADGKRANARITITSACATHFREYTGWDGVVDATFEAPTQEGAYDLLVTATRFPSPPVLARIQLTVGAGGPEPACGELAALPEEPTPAPAPAPALPERAAAIPAAPPLVALLCAALLVAARGRDRKA